MAEQPDWITELDDFYTGGTAYKSPQVPTPDTGAGLIPKQPEPKAPSAKVSFSEEPEWIKELDVKPVEGIPAPSPQVQVTGEINKQVEPDWMKELDLEIPSFTIKNIPEPKPSPTVLGEVGKGLVGGLHDIKSMAGGALAMAGKVVDLPGVENTGREWMEEAKKSSEPYAPAVGSFRDIKSASDVGLYISHGLSRMVPTMAATLIPAILTGGVSTAVGVTSTLGKAALTVAGGLAGSLPLEVGQIAQQQVEAGQDLDATKSLWAIPAAILDVLPQSHAIMRLGVIDKIFKNKAVQEGVKDAIGRAPGFFSKNIVGRVLKQAGIQFAEEAPTEGAQSILERWGANNYKFDKEALDDFVNSFILGGVTGAFFGGMGGVFPENRSRVIKQEAKPPVEQIQAEPSQTAPVIEPRIPTQEGVYTGETEGGAGVILGEERIAKALRESPPEAFTNIDTGDQELLDGLETVDPGIAQAMRDAYKISQNTTVIPEQGKLVLTDVRTGERILDFTENPDTNRMEVLNVYQEGRKIPVEEGQKYPTQLNLFKNMFKVGAGIDIATSIEGHKSIPVKVQEKVDIIQPKPGTVEVTQKQGTPPLVPKAEAVPGVSIGSTVQFTRKDGTPGTGIVAEVNQDGSIMIGLKGGGMVERPANEVSISKPEEGLARIPQPEKSPVPTENVPLARTGDEWEEPKVRGIGRTPKLQFQDVSNYTARMNSTLNTNLTEAHPVLNMQELSQILKRDFNVDVPEGKHFGGYTIKDSLGKWHMYLVQSELTSYQNMVTAAWHEASGHVGIELMMGRDADAFWDRMFEYFMKNDPTAMESISKSYNISPETLYNRRRIAREAFAFFSENNPKHNFVKEFIAMVRRWLRTVFPGIQLTDSEVVSLAMKSREIVTSNESLDMATPWLYRAYKKPFGSAVNEIVLSKTFQGANKSETIGPNDIQYVSRDQSGGDSGRLVVTVNDRTFSVKALEIDPGHKGSGVAERLILNAVKEHGPMLDVSDLTADTRIALDKVVNKYPETYRDNALIGLNRINSEIDDDRIVAAKRIGVTPDKLEYIGKQEFETHYMHLWNVNDPGNPLDGSARSGKNYPMKQEELGMPRISMPDKTGAIPASMPSDESEPVNHSGWGLYMEARKGKDKNFGSKVMKDMGLHEYIWQLPHWVAMKFREFHNVTNVEWERMDKMNQDRLNLTSDVTSTLDSRVDNKFISMKDVKGIEPLIVYSDAENIFLQEKDLQAKAQELIGRTLTPEEVEGYNSWKSGFDRAKNYIKTKALQVLQTRMLSDPIGSLVWASQHGDTTNQFANLNPKDQKHFMDLLNEYNENIAKINTLSERLDAINFYMPRIREKGDYVVRVYAKDENGQTRAVFADRRMSPTAAEELRLKLLEDPKFKNLEVVKTRETVSPEFLFEGLNQARMEAFLGRAVDRAVRKEGLDPKEAQAVMDSIYDSVTNEILARGFRERYMGRTKEGLIEGYKTDDLKSVFMTYMTGLAGSMNKLEATFNFHQALKTIDKAQQKNLFEYASRYVADMLRNSDQTTRTINKFKTLPYAWYLMANLRMVAAQFFQNYIQGASVMSRYIKELDVKNGSKSGIVRTERAMRDIVTGNLTNVEQEFMKKAFNEGETMAKLINEMKGRADSGWFRKVTRVVDIMSIPFSKMETINRQTAILAMFRLGLDQGMNNTQAYDRAKQFVRDVHYAYGKSNMPQLLRDGTTFAQIGGGAYTFRSFTHNFILSMIHYARNPEGKLALDVIGRTLAWTVIMGGLGAAPFLDEILDELEKLTGVPYRSKMRAALKGAGGDVLAQAGMSGLPTLLGVDMSGTLKITPSIPLLGSGNSGSLWGVWGGLGQKGLDAVNFTANGEWARAIESASPTGIEALGKAFRGSTEGVRGKGNKLVVDEMGRPVYLTEGEAARQAIGFRPARVAALSSERRVETNIEKYFTDKRQDIYSKARTAKTSADWEKIARDVTSFNIKAAQYRGVIAPISSQTIRESLKLQTKFPKYSQSVNIGA